MSNLFFSFRVQEQTVEEASPRSWYNIRIRPLIIEDYKGLSAIHEPSISDRFFGGMQSRKQRSSWVFQRRVVCIPMFQQDINKSDLLQEQRLCKLCFSVLGAAATSTLWIEDLRPLFRMGTAYLMFQKACNGVILHSGCTIKTLFAHWPV